jgi:RHS repeat-associated protein
MTKSYLRFFVAFLTILSAITEGCSQIIIHGPTSVQLGTTNLYWYNDGTLYASPNWITGGTNSPYQSGTTYYVNITWATAGTKQVQLYNYSGLIATLNVTVICTPDPAPTFSVESDLCSPRNITYTGTPPGGTTWYWQTSAAGTSTSNPSTSYDATASGTYYVRARNGSLCWSSGAASVSVTVNAAPAPPTTPTVSTNTCGAKILTRTSFPAGVTWYWQGTNSNGTDTGASAAATTYTAVSSGTYYLRSRNNTTGCWSNVAGVVLSVINPSVPISNSFSFCEWEPKILTTTGYTNSMNWYNASGTLLYTGITYTSQELNVGNYFYTVKGLTSGCESTGSATISLEVKSNCDEYLNWTETTAYTVDGNGNTVAVASSKGYSDAVGGSLQVQVKDHVNGQVFASQSVKDNNNLPVLNSLSAPINSSTFVYRHRFMTNATGQRYNANDFDLRAVAPGEPTNPKPVANGGIGTLGWYYSSSNTSEPFTPATTFPYSRSYTPDGPDASITMSGGPGVDHKMGSGHEVVSERQKITSTELSHYYALRSHFVTSPNDLTVPVSPGYKIITTDPDEKKSVTFVDADGGILATAMINGSSYSNWSYSYYNDLGQLVATIAPEGVVIGNTNSPSFVTTYKYDHLGSLIEINSTDEGRTQYVYDLDGQVRFSQNQEQFNASPKRFSYTNYDYQGRIAEFGEYTMSGTGYYVFEPSTVATPAANSILTVIENKIPRGSDIESITSATYTGVSRKLDVSRCLHFVYVKYDRSSGLPGGDANHAIQRNLIGGISKTINVNANTWYSYDEFGRLEWTKQSVPDIGYKTVDYTYDFAGNMIMVAYQKGQSDAFYHHYVYDARQRLTAVYTSTTGTVSTATDLRANYKYYLHGPLKRTELMNGTQAIQGLDYIYNISGGLKAINAGDPASDPGLDGTSGANASFMKDAFGETLHYYDNDYAGAGYSAGSVALNSSNYPNQYGGNLRAVTYNNATGLTLGAISNEKTIYGYQYDNLNQLTNSQWGTVSGSTPAFVENQREQITGYDDNGNIQGLLRKGKSAQTIADYNYVYEANTNKLDKINNSGALFVDYTYNGIGQVTKHDEGTGKVYNMSYDPYGMVSSVRNASNQVLTNYYYDDRGDLIKKISYNAGTAIKNTYYVRDAGGNVMAIYEQVLPSGTVQLVEVPIHGMGRIATYKPLLNTFFYEVGDHLGNVRAVIGAASTDSYTATMEGEVSEEPPFKNIANTRVTYSTASHSGNEVARLNSAKPAGPAISLEVSPGDTLDIDAWAYYFGTGNSNLFDASTTIGIIASAFGGQSGAAGESGQIYNRVNTALGNTFGGGTSAPFPSAFITVIVFDKNYVRKFYASGEVQDENSGVLQHVIVPPIIIEQPGYVYVCLYNRANDANPVYFDDFSVKIKHSRVVVGADYYPFGLVMDGSEIQDEFYRYGYQGQFSEKDITTGMQEFEIRNYDPRVGRWLSPDPYGQFSSPYVGMGNIPNMGVDPDGGLTINPNLPEFVKIGYSYASIARGAGALLGGVGFMAGLSGDCPPDCGSPEKPLNYPKELSGKNYPGDSRGEVSNMRPVDTSPLAELVRNAKPMPVTSTLNVSKPNSWAILRDSGLPGASFTYDLSNSSYVGFASFFLKAFQGNDIYNLDGSYANNRERQIAFTSTAATFLPIPIKIPNPFGKRGSLAHVKRVLEIQQRFLQMGFRHLSGGTRLEMMFGRRFPDLVFINPRTGAKIALQVGRITKKGLPVKRERNAIRDLRATGDFSNVFFFKY